MHSQGFVHLDLKPANIVVVTDPKTKQIRAKLVDFDFTKSFLDSDGNCKPMPAFYGTPHYSAPEVWENRTWVHKGNRGQQVNDIRKTEIWAIGLTFYVLMSGHSPFPYKDDENEDQIKQRLEYCRDQRVEQIVENMPNKDSVGEELKRKVIQMLAESPDKRPDISRLRKSRLWKKKQSTEERSLKDYDINLQTY